MGLIRAGLCRFPPPLPFFFRLSSLRARPTHHPPGPAWTPLGPLQSAHAPCNHQPPQGRVGVIQSLSGTGSLRVGAAFIARWLKGEGRAGVAMPCACALVNDS